MIAFERVRPLTNGWMFTSLTVSALILLLHENGFIKPIIRNEIVLNGFHTAWLSKRFQFHITSYKQRIRRYNQIPQFLLTNCHKAEPSALYKV